MSWSITATAADSKSLKGVLDEQTYMPDAVKSSLIQLFEQLPVAAGYELNPDRSRTILIESHGHIDQFNGNLTIKMQTIEALKTPK